MPKSTIEKGLFFTFIGPYNLINKILGINLIRGKTR